MKHLLSLALVNLLIVTAAFSDDEVGKKPPHAMPAKVDTEFTPQVGLEYSLQGGPLYYHDDRNNPGPAALTSSAAWSFANEFLYRTALAKQYILPAGSVSLRNNGWWEVGFTAKDGKSRLIVEVQMDRRIARLPIQGGQK